LKPFIIAVLAAMTLMACGAKNVPIEGSKTITVPEKISITTLTHAYVIFTPNVLKQYDNGNGNEFCGRAVYIDRGLMGHGGEYSLPFFSCLIDKDSDGNYEGIMQHVMGMEDENELTFPLSPKDYTVSK